MTKATKLTNIHINGKWKNTLEGYYGNEKDLDVMHLRTVDQSSPHVLRDISLIEGVINVGALIESTVTNPVEFRGKFLVERYHPRQSDVEESLVLRAVAEPVRSPYGDTPPAAKSLADYVPQPVTPTGFYQKESDAVVADLEDQLKALDTRNDPSIDDISSRALQALNIAGASLDSVRAILRLYENSLDSAAGTPGDVVGHLRISGRHDVHDNFLQELPHLVKNHQRMFPDAPPIPFMVKARDASKPYLTYRMDCILVNTEHNDGDDGTHETLTFEVQDYVSEHDKDWAPTTSVELTLDDLSGITSALYLIQQVGGRDFTVNELKRFAELREKMMDALNELNK